MPSATAPVGNKPTNSAKKAPTPSVPFTRAARMKSQQAFNTGPTALTALTQPINPIDLPPAGFLRYIELIVTGTTAANAAAVTFAADSPFNVISYLTVGNSAGDSIIVPITGYQLMLLNKYGAFSEDPPNCDPRAVNNLFSTTAGAGATGGSFKFKLRVPFEFDPRDAFCSLPNLAANKAYQLTMQLSPSALLYGVAPTTPPSVSIAATMHYWTQPNPTNAIGAEQETAPLGNGSVSLVRLQTPVVSQGDKLTQLTNTGNVIRNLIFTLRTAAGARTDADWSTLSQIILNNDPMFYLPIDEWTSLMSKAYGYTSAAKDAANGLDTGVYVLAQLNTQRGRVLCDGPRDQYLATLDATLLQIRNSSFGANASTLEVLSNEIKPVSGLALYSPNLY